MLEHGDFRLRRTNEPLTIANQMARGLYEGVMTLLGLLVVITPLAIWTVPFGGPFANTAFYIVLSVGCGSFIAFIILAYLKGLLFPDHSPHGTPDKNAGVHKDRLEAFLTWERSQDDARRVEQQLRTIEGSSWHNFAYMARIATLLGTIVLSVFLGGWAFMHFYYGSTEVLSEQARYNLIKKDLNWSWKY